jgi:hypothetical protein
MSRRKNQMHCDDGEIVLQCPNKHRIGFVVVPSRYNPHVDRLGRVDQRIELGRRGNKYTRSAPTNTSSYTGLSTAPNCSTTSERF